MHFRANKNEINDKYWKVVNIQHTGPLTWSNPFLSWTQKGCSIKKQTFVMTVFEQIPHHINNQVAATQFLSYQILNTHMPVLTLLHCFLGPICYNVIVSHAIQVAPTPGVVVSCYIVTIWWLIFKGGD